MLYFGCPDRDLGHYWFTSDSMKQHGKGSVEPIDGIYAPYEDGGRAEKPQGVCRVRQVNGHTVVAWWDRSMDRRPGSNSAFVVPGEHTFAEVIALAKTKYPWVFARMTFELREES